MTVWLMSPSEAEWEYAARGGTTMRYAFGNAITLKDANYSESKLGKTTKVGSYLSNAWGLYDMHGNAWEWVEDVWHSSYEGASTDGTAWIDREVGNSSSNRVVRGGSWIMNPRNQQDDLNGAKPYGEPWEVVVPTSLVYLQNNSDLPEYKCTPDVDRTICGH